MRRWMKKLTQMALLVWAFFVFTAGLIARGIEAQYGVTYTFKELDPPAAYVMWWEYALRCSGVKPQPGGDYEDIRWYTFSPPMYHGPFRTLAYWTQPNTIRVDSTLVLDMGTIVHEMLHHAMRGPELPDSLGGAHPYNPFVVPCGVGITAPNYTKEGENDSRKP